MAPAVLLILGLLVWLSAEKTPAPSVAPQAVSETNATTSISVSLDDAASPPQAAEKSLSLTINPADTIVSWNFAGGAVGNDVSIKKAKDEIVRLNSLLGTGEFSDYLLYVSIANQYNLLGDGASEFEFLKKAIALDSLTTGLAWHNAGQLFTRLGAYKTARTAFERAVAAQPIAQYHQALLYFLKAQYPSDSAAIAKEEAVLSAQKK